MPAQAEKRGVTWPEAGMGRCRAAARLTSATNGAREEGFSHLADPLLQVLQQHRRHPLRAVRRRQQRAGQRLELVAGVARAAVQRRRDLCRPGRQQLQQCCDSRSGKSSMLQGHAVDCWPTSLRSLLTMPGPSSSRRPTFDVHGPSSFSSTARAVEESGTLQDVIQNLLASWLVAHVAGLAAQPLRQRFQFTAPADPEAS